MSHSLHEIILVHLHLTHSWFSHISTLVLHTLSLFTSMWNVITPRHCSIVELKTFVFTIQMVLFFLTKTLLYETNPSRSLHSRDHLCSGIDPPVHHQCNGITLVTGDTPVLVNVEGFSSESQSKISFQVVHEEEHSHPSPKTLASLHIYYWLCCFSFAVGKRTRENKAIWIGITGVMYFCKLFQISLILAIQCSSAHLTPFLNFVILCWFSTWSCLLLSLQFLPFLLWFPCCQMLTDANVILQFTEVDVI